LTTIPKRKVGLGIGVPTLATRVLERSRERPLLAIADIEVGTAYKPKRTLDVE
jgi:hypothetical protein